MKKIIKILSASFAVILCLTTFAGCGKKTHEELLTPTRITNDFTSEIKTAGYEFDSLDKFSSEMIETSEKDMKKLKELFDNRVEYQKVGCTFTISSLEKDIEGYFSMVYAYINDEWKVMFSYPSRKDEWEFTAKDTVGTKQMLADLKTLNFEGFEKGYVGSEKTTTIKIEDRDTKLKFNKDEVLITATVKTDFATYSIDIQLIYYFKDGKWILSDTSIENSTDWSIEYNSDKKPIAPKEEYILEQLTIPTNFLTYVANPEYMTDYKIAATKQIAGVTSIKYQYVLTTFYENIGTVKYTAEIPYDWVEGEWAIGDPEVKISEVDPSAMLGTWSNENGDYFELVKYNPDKNNPLEGKLKGTYYKKIDDGKYGSYSFNLMMKIPLRDNNWGGIVDSWTATDSSAVEFSINSFAIDTQAKTLRSTGSDDSLFTKTKSLEIETTKPAEGTEEPAESTAAESVPAESEASESTAPAETTETSAIEETKSSDPTETPSE